MLTAIIPKLPMRNKAATRHFYINQLGFADIGSQDYDEYLIIQKDNCEIHLFSFKGLDPLTNYGQVYIRTTAIDVLYNTLKEAGVAMHPAGHLQAKPWGQKEFALLDPDNNLLTFGQPL